MVAVTTTPLTYISQRRQKPLGLRKVGMTTRNSIKLLQSVMQADEILRGVRVPSRKFQIDATSIKALRASLELSQAKFAALLSVDLGTLRNWEQGRREPTGPAKALLRAIRNDPKAVLSALAV